MSRTNNLLYPGLSLYRVAYTYLSSRFLFAERKRHFIALKFRFLSENGGYVEHQLM